VAASSSLTATYTASTTAMISMFEIYIADFSIIALRYNISGQLTTTLDLLMKLQLSYDLPIPDIPLYAIAAQPSFSVAGVSVLIGANLGLFLKSSIDVATVGSVSAGIDATWVYSIVHQRGSIYPEEISTASVQRQVFNVHALKVDLNEVGSVLRFGPALEASLGLVLFGAGAQASADVYIYSEIRGSFSYPAKDALSSSSVPHTVLGTVGNCFVPHYLEVNWDVDVNGTFQGVLLTKQFAYNTQLLKEPMAFACLISSSSSSNAASFPMTISNVVPDSASSLASMLKDDFASFLSCDESSIYVNVNSSGNFQVTFLNGDSSLASSLCAAISSPTSSIYSSSYKTMTTLAGQVSADCSAIQL